VIPPEQPPQSGAEGVGVFATTHWSVVVRAGDSGSPEAASAMERLCQTYWYPLYVFVRRKGYSHEEASDLTQAYFANSWRETLSQVCGCGSGQVPHVSPDFHDSFPANEWTKTQAQKTRRWPAGDLVR